MKTKGMSGEEVMDYAGTPLTEQEKEIGKKSTHS
jgi:hypothetical protein